MSHEADSTLVDSDPRKELKDLEGAGVVIIHRASHSWAISSCGSCVDVLGEVQAPIVRAPIKINIAATCGRKSFVSGGFDLTGLTGVVEGQIKPFNQINPAGTV